MSTHLQRGEFPTIAIGATFVAEPVERSLAFWLTELGMTARIAFAPYNQVFQQLLDPASLIAANRNGVNVLLLRPEDWGREVPESASPADGQSEIYGRIERNMRELALAVSASAGRTGTPHLACLCPASPAGAADPFFSRMEELFVSELADRGGVYVVTSAELAARYPVAEYHDPHGEKMAHLPYTPLFYTALGTIIARKVHALKTEPYKVIVLDCDDTLWSGVCGEDGAFGVRIDSVRRSLQEFMVRRHDAGMLLCLCSKNNEEDVVEVFERRPEMVLKRDHIVSWRLNWARKSDNIRSVARELNLGLDSFIFIDDDPLECAEVQANCPEVLTLQLPREPAKIASFLRHVWAFDPLRVTEEGRERTALYRQNARREQFRREAPSFGEFLAGLALKVRLSPAAPRQYERIAELTQRTNQFNLTTIRRSAAEVEKLAQGGAECFVAHVRDRFGDYGLSGVIVLTGEPDALVLDTFLLSCRVLGRGVEHRILANLGEIARERGLGYVKVPYLPTRKNQPARNFLDSVGGNFKEPFGTGFLCKFPRDFAAKMADKVDAILPNAPSLAETPLAASPPPGASGRISGGVLRWIATDLCNAERIHKAIAARLRPQPEREAAFAAPRTEAELKIAEIFSELLGIGPIGINDNFMQLGGHSLLAMQILSRIRAVFQIEIPLEVFFSGEFTVGELAKKIVKHQLMQSSVEDITAALSVVQDLSDDEAKALLGTKTSRRRD